MPDEAPPPAPRPIEKVTLAEAFARVPGLWQPRIVGEVNDAHVKLARLHGEFVWHHHAQEDELFLVVRGRLRIRLRDGEVVLGPGELVVIPRGVEHLPIAEEECHVLLLEPRTTRNTGTLQNDRTFDATPL